MKRPIPFSTRFIALAVTTVAAGGAQGCSTLIAPTPLNELLAPLDMALRRSPVELKQQAEAGDGQAQLAMAIVSQHGLHGEQSDFAAAAYWTNKAQTNRRTMPITQYTAAFNNQPSRVNLIYVPVPTIPPAQFSATERCVSQLSSGTASAPACGDDAASRDSRRQAWFAATS